MTSEYSVRRTGRTSDAVVTRDGKKVASLRGEGEARFRLEAGSERWSLDPRVHGEIRPFSMRVTAADAPAKEVLTIRNHVFFHDGKAFMLTAVPEDVHPADHVLGKRHVIMLDGFPFSRLEDIDLQTWGRLRRQRGTSVGTIDGLGLEEFRVNVSRDLEDIGLQLAAASYLLYSTG